MLLKKNVYTIKLHNKLGCNFLCTKFGAVLRELDAAMRRVQRISVGGRPAWWMAIFHTGPRAPLQAQKASCYGCRKREWHLHMGHPMYVRGVLGCGDRALRDCCSADAQ